MQVNGLRFNGLYRINGTDNELIKKKAAEIDDKSAFAIGSSREIKREKPTAEGVLVTPALSMMVATDEDAFTLARDLGMKADLKETKAENEKRFDDHFASGSDATKEQYELAVLRYFLYKETVGQVETIEV